MAAISLSYPPLTRPHEIRLLTLHHGNTKDPITSTLTTIVLNSHSKPNPKYTALSYCWGPSSPPGASPQIKINNNLISIRENLYSALLHLRMEDRDRILWVDAICINQNDIQERNHQVRLMGSIYAFAGEVVAWLGVEGSDDGEMEGLCSSSSTLETPASRTDGMNKEGKEEEDEIIGIYGPPISAPTRLQKAIRNLCEREYWSRMWIIQECYHAKTLLLQCGAHLIPYEKLAHYIVSEGGLLLRSPANGALRVREGMGERGIEGLIDRYLDRKCVDKRDSVYGLLSICSVETNSFIKVDYGKSLVGVYCDVFEFGVERARGKERGLWLSEMYETEDLSTVAFSQVLCWVLHLEAKGALLSVRDEETWVENLRKPSWGHGPTVQDQHVRAYTTSFSRDRDLGNTPLYLEEKSYRRRAQSALLGLCCGEDISDDVMAWLRLGNDAEIPENVCSPCECWPFRFPERVRHLSRLELFVAAFGNYRVLGMEWSKMEIVIHVLRNPVGFKQRVVMQRATGEFRVYREKVSETLGDGVGLWKRSWNYARTACSFRE